MTDSPTLPGLDDGLLRDLLQVFFFSLLSLSRFSRVLRAALFKKSFEREHFCFTREEECFDVGFVVGCFFLFCFFLSLSLVLSLVALDSLFSQTVSLSVSSSLDSLSSINNKLPTKKGGVGSKPFPSLSLYSNERGKEEKQHKKTGKRKESRAGCRLLLSFNEWK